MSTAVVGTAIIVGAGVGGLTAAVGLAQRGWSVRVLERAERLEPVGAGIVLAPNAVRALDSLGLGEALRAAGHIPSLGGVRNRSGRWLQRVPAMVARDGTPTITIRRHDLVELLIAALPAGSVELGVRVTAFREDADGVVIQSSAGDVEAEVMIGADGVNSVTRSLLFPGHPVPASAGFTAWRAVMDLPADEAAETWGRGKIFGVVPLGPDRTYIYATGLSSGATRLDAASFRARFAGWHEPIPRLLESVTDESLLAHDVTWLHPQLTRFSKGRVALVGDAAHSMTPNLGQGACQAIEDAVTLAVLLLPTAVERSLGEYSAARVGRANRIARRSMAMSRLAHLRGALVCGLRDRSVTLAGILAPSAFVRGARSLVEWTVPKSK